MAAAFIATRIRCIVEGVRGGGGVLPEKPQVMSPVSAFRSLSAEQQEVLWLAEVERVSTEDIASIMGIDTAAVVAIAALAERLLRLALDQPGEPPDDASARNQPGTEAS